MARTPDNSRYAEGSGLGVKGARLTPRGYAGPGRGRVSHVSAPREWRGTTSQVCGLYPWVVGSGSPTIGTPIGRHLLSGTAVCFDPISWFERARVLLNPSAFVLGVPATGKSSLTRRLVIGAAATGTIPIVAGDLKPDYKDTIRALGGSVIAVGRGAGSVNPLDAGALDAAAERIGGKAGQGLAEEAHGRRLALVRALVAVVRGSRTSDTEDVALSAALRLLRERHTTAAPVLEDLVALLESAPEAVRLVVLDRGRDSRYRQVVDPLQRSLLALIDGPLGSVFARPTSERVPLDATGVCLDVSGISTSDGTLSAAALLACWAEAFATVEAANALADHGVAPPRRFLLILDELWRALRAGGVGMVDNIDALTRLNRSQGVGQIMVSHSLADLRALPDEHERAKARGFVERAGAVVLGGLPSRELAEVAEVVHLTQAERDLVSSWSTPPGWGEAAEPPGRGKFLVKVGVRPGVPVQVELSPAELGAMDDSNRRWAVRA
jgi:hypothetical protein